MTYYGLFWFDGAHPLSFTWECKHVCKCFRVRLQIEVIKESDNQDGDANYQSSFISCGKKASFCSV